MKVLRVWVVRAVFQPKKKRVKRATKKENASSSFPVCGFPEDQDTEAMPTPRSHERATKVQEEHENAVDSG